MNKLQEELAQLEAEREHDEKMQRAGYILAPWGGWIPLETWRQHIRSLRIRAENNPQRAP